jgi:hypothetical protein
MPRNTNITEMQTKLARYNERTKEAAAALSKLEESRNALKAKIEAEERKARTHNLCQVGGLAYKYFGDDLSPDEFKELLDFVFSINEVQDFINSEKEKRFLRDNPPVVVDASESVEETTPFISGNSETILDEDSVKTNIKDIA